MSGATFEGLKLEIEFVDGTWTDVTQWADWTQGGSVKGGRTSKYSQPQTGVFTCVLTNTDGRFTPLRSVLADGITAHPYYPNVRPRRRVRYGFTVAGVYYQRFLGFCEDWPPGTPDGVRSRVVLNAYDEQQLWAGVKLQPCIATELLKDGPRAWYPLADDSGATYTRDRAGNKPNLTEAGNLATPVAFGSEGPVGAETGAAGFANSAVLVVDGFNFVHDQATIEFWLLVDADSHDGSAMIGTPGVPNLGFRVFWLEGGAMYFDVGAEVRTGLLDAGYRGDRTWHHYLVTYERANRVQLYVDGALVSWNNYAPDVPLNIGYLSVGGESPIDTFLDGMRGRMSNLAFYDKVLTEDRITAHVAAGRAWAGETVDKRIKRLLGEAWEQLGLDYGDGFYSGGVYGGGLDSNIDESYVVLSGYQQGGKFALPAMQDAVTSEGGGAALFVDNRTGLPRFLYRGHRDPGAPTLTITAGEDDDGPAYQPSYGSRGILNSIDATAADGSGSTAVGVATDVASIREFALSSDSLTSWAADPLDALYNAQDRVAALSQPAFRLQRLEADLWTSKNDLWAAAATASISDRIRYDKLPSKFAPRTWHEVLIQGYEDDFTDSSYTISYDTDPVDMPTRLLLDDAVYSALGGDGITLHTTLTASLAATTVLADVPGGAPQFTTDPTDWPFAVRIDEEDMLVTNVGAGTGGATQTLTVTRAVNGSTVAAHTAAAAINLSPAPAWSI